MKFYVIMSVILFAVLAVMVICSDERPSQQVDPDDHGVLPWYDLPGAKK
jgi:hypothetical protein